MGRENNIHKFSSADIAVQLYDDLIHHKRIYPEEAMIQYELKSRRQLREIIHHNIILNLAENKHYIIYYDRSERCWRFDD